MPTFTIKNKQHAFIQYILIKYLFLRRRGETLDLTAAKRLVGLGG